MRDSGPSKPSGGEKPNPRRAKPKAHRPPEWLLLVAVAACAVVVGAFAARLFWHTGARKEAWRRQEESLGAREDSFPEPAFSPTATTEDLKHEAVRVASELVEGHPNCAHSLAVMAGVQSDLGNSAEAVKYWERCVQLDPNLVEAYCNMGVVARDRGDYGKAADLFRQAWASDPRDLRVPVLLGDVLMKGRKIEEAIEVLEKHLEQRTQQGLPTSAEVVVTLAHAYLQVHEYRKAEWAFETAIQVAPTDKRAHYGLARACARLGQKEKARQHMETFKRLAKDQLSDRTGQVRAFDDLVSTRELVARAHLGAGRAYLKHGNIAKAERIWRKAAVLDPKNIECRTALASLYEQNNREREALQVCEQLRKIDPQNADYWLNVGLLSARLDRLDAALAAVEQAIRLDPGNPRYREAYELIKKGN